MEEQPTPSLVTRWSMLEQLSDTRADEAWRWFIDRYRPFARGVLGKLLRARGRGSELETVLDECWTYLFSSDVFRRAERGRRFRSFLAGTLRNFGRDYCRRNQHGQAPDEGQEFEPGAMDPLPENEELALFAHQVLHLALKQLENSHPANAQAVRWFYGVDQGDLTTLREPLSVTEIAVRLDIKPNAVNQVLHKARRRLRARIEAELRDTVADDADIEDEVRMILDALGADAPGLTAG